jgi:hypothetical protein
MSYRDIIEQVQTEGKLYLFNYPRWFGYGHRLGQVHYETRYYQDGAVRHRFWGPGISETYGKEGENEKDLPDVQAVPGVSEANGRG